MATPSTWVSNQWTRRSSRFWLLTGLALWMGSLAILVSLDAVTDDKTPDFVVLPMFVIGWAGILVLLAVGLGAIRRWVHRQREK